eukprot:gene5637-7652_t
MKDITDGAFKRVQSYSADWHADSFAGATVRRLSRAMWGYDVVTDAALIWFGPAIIVLFGLCGMMAMRWPVVGLFAFIVVVIYVASNIFLTALYARPANLRSVALDSRIGGAIADSISSNATVKSFGAEAGEEARIAGVTQLWLTATMRSWNRFTDLWLFHNLILVGLQAGLTGSGDENDAARIRAVRDAAPNNRLILDANEGWTDDNVAENIAAAAALGVTLIEQPLPAGRDGKLRHIARPVPICADESVHATNDIETLVGLYDA